ncbi:MAG: anti-sigma factor [Verrucomicrobiales bacterium]|nr:anti-sigma factor [Verrucomicrobiales bacterium]
MRLLSEQVAMLTHVLAQRAVLPAGAAQLQVFRLVSSNALPEASEALIADSRRTGPTPSPGTPSASASTSDNTTGTTSGTTLASATAELPLALALAAARQFASLNASQETISAPGLTDSATTVSRNAAVSPPGIAAPTGGSEVTSLTPEVPATQDSIQVLELAQGSGNSLVGGSKAASSTEASILSSSDATAFGAYSPETGQGAIAFRLSVGSPESEVLQLWMTDPHSGLVQSVGFASLNPVSIPSQVVVLRFNADTAAFSNPAFMITREPAGGSIVPTGPIVAQPPPSTVFPPNP